MAVADLIYTLLLITLCGLGIRWIIQRGRNSPSNDAGIIADTSHHRDLDQDSLDVNDSGGSDGGSGDSGDGGGSD